jgi:gluconate:H+ symporter, GntP family
MVQISLSLLISILVLIAVSRYLKLHPFFSLLLAALVFGTLQGNPILKTFSEMQSGFGLMLQQIGFLVAIGSCLGIVMEKTGAMTTLGNSIVKSFGPKRTVLAMSLIGVVVGIPVFCDSGFIILSRLVPSIASASGTSAQLSLALSSGLYTTHTLVPPTPGPLAAAANLGITSHLGLIILIGLLASIPVATVAYFLAKKLGVNIPVTLADIQSLDQKNHSLLLCFLPLVLPILLIACGSLPTLFIRLQSKASIFQIIGNPAPALLVGLLFSFFLVKGKQKQEWPGWIAEALKDAGIILLITGAGGAFGSVIKSSGVDLLLKEYISGSQAGGVAFLLVGFALAAILKTAQGSSTSSIIITSSLLAPLASSAGFVSPVALATLIVAIGGGAMTVSHANDSYFWVVSQFSGIHERNAYRSYTVITLAQGVTALLTSILLLYLL